MILLLGLLFFNFHALVNHAVPIPLSPYFKTLVLAFVFRFLCFFYRFACFFRVTFSMFVFLVVVSEFL